MDMALQLQRIQKVNQMLKEKPDVSSTTWRQHIIEVAVKYCYTMYPEAMEQHLKVIGKHKENLIDEQFGLSDKSKIEMRAIMNLPTHLNELITQLLAYFLPEEPPFMEVDGESIWFFNKYPQFRLADKI
jgi:hypothetical protein